MTHDKSALLGLLETLRSAEEGDRMRLLLASGLQALIDAEAEAHIGAGRHERTPARTTQRNGTRDRLVATTAGDVTVAIPKTRTGSFLPALLTPRRRIDRALHAVVCEAYVHGVSTRKVDDLVAALGVESGISKSEVSRICAQLDAEVAAWRDRPLDHTWFPYLYLDATYLKVRLHPSITHRTVATSRTAPGGVDCWSPLVVPTTAISVARQAARRSDAIPPPTHTVRAGAGPRVGCSALSALTAPDPGRVRCDCRWWSRRGGGVPSGGEARRGRLGWGRAPAAGERGSR